MESTSKELHESKKSFTDETFNEFSKISKYELVKQVSDYLVDECNICDPHNRHLIAIFAESMEIYDICSKEIDKEGLVISYNNGMTQGANPYISIRNKTTITIIQIMRELGLTPKSRLFKKQQIRHSKKNIIFFSGSEGITAE
jgi:P27 family predicted phage terminase small subunit